MSVRAQAEAVCGRAQLPRRALVPTAVLTILVLVLPCFAAPAKAHVISFGKTTTVPWTVDYANAHPLTLKVRPLMVDARVKEFTVGAVHEVTERLFTVQRAFRLNDALPQDGGPPRWQWQRGGWLLVDRITGHIAPLTLQEFDPFYSTVSWYRDYAAYCGVSDDGRKIYAVVAQIGRRKPALKKMLVSDAAADELLGEDTPDSACAAPAWERAPARVSFAPANSARQTFAVRGHVVDVVSEDEENDEEASK